MGGNMQAQKMQQSVPKRGNHRRTRSTIPDELNKMLVIGLGQKEDKQGEGEDSKQQCTLDVHSTLQLQQEVKSQLHKHSFLTSSLVNDPFGAPMDPIISEEDPNVESDLPIIEITGINQINENYYKKQYITNAFGQKIKASKPNNVEESALTNDLELHENFIQQHHQKEQQDHQEEKPFENESYMIAIQQAKLYENNTNHVGIKSKIDKTSLKKIVGETGNKVHEILNHIEILSQQQLNLDKKKQPQQSQPSQFQHQYQTQQHHSQIKPSTGIHGGVQSKPENSKQQPHFFVQKKHFKQ